MSTLAFQKPENRENTKGFEDFIILLATFSQGVCEVLHEILKVFNTHVRLFRGFASNIEGVQHAPFLTFFSEGVGVRVSMSIL